MSITAMTQAEIVPFTPGKTTKTNYILSIPIYQLTTSYLIRIFFFQRQSNLLKAPFKRDNLSIKLIQKLSHKFSHKYTLYHRLVKVSMTGLTVNKQMDNLYTALRYTLIQEIRSNFFFIINTYLRSLEAISRACSGHPKGRLSFGSLSLCNLAMIIAEGLLNVASKIKNRPWFV